MTWLDLRNEVEEVFAGLVSDPWSDTSVFPSPRIGDEMERRAWARLGPQLHRDRFCRWRALRGIVFRDHAWHFVTAPEPRVPLRRAPEVRAMLLADLAATRGNRRVRWGAGKPLQVTA